jgi:uncharacterized protein YigE (DUF2233 family)
VISLILTAILCYHSPQIKSKQPDSLWEGTIAGIPVRVIKINLNDPRVKISVQGAPGFPNRAYSMPLMVQSTRPDIAINGTYASKQTLIPIGDVVIRGQKVNTGNMGTVMAVTKDNQVLIRRVPHYRTMQWPGYETVLGCGPALVLDSKVDVKPEEEHFGDPHIMGSTVRMGVGVRPDNTLLLVNTKKGVTFRKWADVMLKLGCRDAYNLDAGASLGMYYRGKMIIKPGRHITNILGIWITRPLPEFADLCPMPGALKPAVSASKQSTLRFPYDPGNSTHPKAKVLTLCGDTMLRATEGCPTTVKRRIAPDKSLKSCSVHRAR